MTKKGLLAVVLLVFLVALACGGCERQLVPGTSRGWSQTFGGPGDNEGRKVQQEARVLTARFPLPGLNVNA